MALLAVEPCPQDDTGFVTLRGRHANRRPAGTIDQNGKQVRAAYVA